MENQVVVDLYNFALSRKRSGIITNWDNDMFISLIEEIIRLKRIHEGFLLEPDYREL